MIAPEARRATNERTCRRNDQRNYIEIAGSVLFLEHKPGLGSVTQDGVAGNAIILTRGSLSAQGRTERGEKRLD